MSIIRDYTLNARKFSMRFPALSHFLIQVTFWVLANNLMALAIHLHSRLLAIAFLLPVSENYLSTMILATMLGFLYAIVPGLVYRYIDQARFRDKPIVLILFSKFLVTFTTGTLVFTFIFNSSKKLSIPLLLPEQLSDFDSLQTRGYTFFIYMLYFLVMSLLLAFINFNNRKYGPGILLPLLFGKYRRPVSEVRILMFLDLQHSTEIAEKIGDLKYSAMIRDCFMDIDHEVARHFAEIYQYAGDEIILSWNVPGDCREHLWLDFFFSCQQRLASGAKGYYQKYGVIPKFKAGVHKGTVTVVEVGSIKQDIAFHGDSINIASRIQSLCNTYNETLLISDSLLSNVPSGNTYKLRNFGPVQLKGRQKSLGIFGIEFTTQS